MSMFSLPRSRAAQRRNLPKVAIRVRGLAELGFGREIHWQSVDFCASFLPARPKRPRDCIKREREREREREPRRPFCLRRPPQPRQAWPATGFGRPLGSACRRVWPPGLAGHRVWRATGFGRPPGLAGHRVWPATPPWPGYRGHGGVPGAMTRTRNTEHQPQRHGLT